MVLLEAFYNDIKKYLDYKDPMTGKSSDWIGHYLESNKVNTESMYCRGFLQNCELYDTYVRVDMDSAWGSIPEVWDKMGEKYNLNYVYISEEPGNEVYTNSDVEGRFFSTRYILNYFELDYLELDSETLSKYGELLKELSEETHYYDDFSDVMDDFEGFGFIANNIEKLNLFLDKFGIKIYEYSPE